ncbi:MAG: UDP-2,4-diacetamido-2,4,6-trideoxy-beta-L-altropyranose hydrolase [Candidatus Gastranaerophilales bacterium]|nr:UDP-2,4-diacetamido-2,4,6-trideoxy-beta-L-altropyranose hydrolase [Candidatus Gastranaerophilales bacterium]
MYLFRADGNEKVGMGHLMRCLTIAEALAQKLGGRDEILFCCADEQSAEPVRARYFTARVFHTDYRDLMQETFEWEKINSKTSVILIDSYYATDPYLLSLKKSGVTILMDDMQEHCFPVDAVINYNIFAREERYLELYRDKNTDCYVGGDYAPVRPQFTALPYQVRPQIADVMITTGGGDVDNIASAVLETLMSEEKELNMTKRMRYHLVAGRFNPHLRELEQLAEGDPYIVLHKDVQDMAGLMCQCDLAVTAGGTTVYELAAVGVPFLCFSYARNQEPLVHYIGEEKIAGYAGDYHLDKAGTLLALRRLFREIGRDAEKRNECYLKEKSLVDGLGAGRIAEKLIDLSKRAG